MPFTSGPMLLTIALTLLTLSVAQDLPILLNTTSPIRLAIQPACGALNASSAVEINTGINLDAIRTIVAFGDSWTSNGANGSIPVPPMLWPPSPSAGSRVTSNRRASNGFVWVEDLANRLSAKLLNYAWGGAVIDNYAWNTTTPLNRTGIQRTDFVSETRLFFNQGRMLDTLNPSQTLYTIAFGINDEGQYEIAGGDWAKATDTYISKLGELQANGAQNILIHGMYKFHTNTKILQDSIFSYLRDSHNVNGTSFANVDLERLFDYVATSPASFGYKGNSTCLVSSTTTIGGCTDPDHSVFWIPGHPSYVTHNLISQYTITTLNACRSG